MDNINYKTLAFKLPMALAARNAIFSADFARPRHDGDARRLRRQERAISSCSAATSSSPELLCKDLGERVLRRRGRQAVVGLPRDAPLHRRLHADRRRSRYSIPTQVAKRHYPHDAANRSRALWASRSKSARSPQVSGAFSIIYTAAVAIADQMRFAPIRMNREAMEDPALKRLVEKIEIAPTLAARRVPDGGGRHRHARTGRRITPGAMCPKGDIYKQPDERRGGVGQVLPETSSSPRRCCARLMRISVVGIVSRLEELDDIGELIAFMR